MLISRTNRPRVIITMGDPAGIGPELIAKVVASREIERLATFVIIADRRLMEDLFEKPVLKNVFFAEISSDKKIPKIEPGYINVIDPGPALGSIIAGKATNAGAKKALDCIDLAVKLIKDNDDKSFAQAIVTAPVNKAAIAEICHGFMGHTEYLQEAFGVKRTTMVLSGDRLKVIPLTRHIPLKDVASHVTVDEIVGTIAQTVEYRRMVAGKDDAVIGVCALNPHGGENGKIGREEIDLISPAVEKAKKNYARIEGPIPADVAFYKALQGKLDIVIGMYHDQCLAPFKMLEFETGVNMTLGLGCVRTSPDHGTAFDIAGKGIASSGSMEQAVRLAIKAIS